MILTVGQHVATFTSRPPHTTSNESYLALSQVFSKVRCRAEILSLGVCAFKRNVKAAICCSRVSRAVQQQDDTNLSQGLCESVCTFVRTRVCVCERESVRACMCACMHISLPE